MSPDSPLSSVEDAEWGAIRHDSIAAKYLLSYAPYENISCSSQLGQILITGWENDMRVPIWHSLKWAARVRKSGGKVVCNIGKIGGHSGSLESSMFETAFLLKNIERV